MNSLLKLIKDSPLSYLPRESLRSLAHFREGYRSRCNMEGAPYEWQYDHWEFRAWLCRHFQMSSEASIHDIGIIELFSTSEVDAFHRHFALLAEFLSTADGAKEESAKSLVDSKMERQDFVEMAKAIRHCPAMYLGSASFLGFSSYLMGDERAQLEMQRADKETILAEQERERAEQLQKRADTAEKKAKRLAEKLRKLGIDPNGTDG